MGSSSLLRNIFDCVTNPKRLYEALEENRELSRGQFQAPEHSEKEDSVQSFPFIDQQAYLTSFQRDFTANKTNFEAEIYLIF